MTCHTDMSQSLTSSDHQLEHTLSQAMEQFQPAGKQTAVLERFKAIALGLKAKGATCLGIILCGAKKQFNAC